MTAGITPPENRDCMMLSYEENRKNTHLRGKCVLLVETTGLGPVTPCMSSKYSNQLSYASEEIA